MVGSHFCSHWLTHTAALTTLYTTHSLPCRSVLTNPPGHIVVSILHHSRCVALEIHLVTLLVCVVRKAWLLPRLLPILHCHSGSDRLCMCVLQNVHLTECV